MKKKYIHNEPIYSPVDHVQRTNTVANEKHRVDFHMREDGFTPSL